MKARFFKELFYVVACFIEAMIANIALLAIVLFASDVKPSDVPIISLLVIFASSYALIEAAKLWIRIDLYKQERPESEKQ